MDNKISPQEAEQRIADLKEKYQITREKIISEAAKRRKIIDDRAANAHHEAQASRLDWIRRLNIEKHRMIQEERERYVQAVSDVRGQIQWMPVSDEHLANKVMNDCHNLHRLLSACIGEVCTPALMTEKARISFEQEGERVYFTISIPRLTMMKVTHNIKSESE